MADPDVAQITHAGAVGRWTPEAIGDYVGGPNHVLPTSRSARFSSGLSVLDFMKRTTIARMPPKRSPKSATWPRGWRGVRGPDTAPWYTPESETAEAIASVTPDALSQIGPLAETLAASEGLDGHGASVRQRLKQVNR